jgi:uncharacterized protein (DUF362 family)
VAGVEGYTFEWSVSNPQEVSTTDRRDFLKTSLLAGGALVAGESLDSSRSGRGVGATAAYAAADRARLVLARDQRLRPSGKSFDSDRVAELLDRAMQTYYDSDDPVEPWKTLVRPDEVVGLKVNCLSGRGNSTSPELVDAVCERLRQAGVPAENIVIWDRLNKDLDSGGFKIAYKGPGVRCFGNDALGFEDELSTFGAVGSLVCRTLTRVCDCVINMPVVKDHSIAGITVSLKNMFGAIHNPNKYHLSLGDPYVPDVYTLPEIRNKIRLIICDATTIQYEGGPSYLPYWAWAFDGLIVGHDPVALDHTGWQLIERKRADEGMKSLHDLERPPTYLDTAADEAHRLGTNDPDRIDLVEV